jgi:hypothetical protein
VLSIPKVPIRLADGSYVHWAPRGGSDLTVLDTDGSTITVALSPDEDPPVGIPYILDSDGSTQIFLSYVNAVYSMNLTTRARVKASLGGITSTDYDALIDSIIADVSARFERYMRRQVLHRTLTEDVPVSRYSTVYSLDSYPVDSIASVKYASRPSDLATATALSTDDYAIEDANTGLVRFFIETGYRDFRRPGTFRIEYTGGMATDTADFVATYPEIARAADIQCAYEYMRKNTPGGSVSSDTGSASFDSALQMLETSKQALAGHRRTLIG